LLRRDAVLSLSWHISSLGWEFAQYYASACAARCVCDFVTFNIILYNILGSTLFPLHVTCVVHDRETISQCLSLVELQNVFLRTFLRCVIDDHPETAYYLAHMNHIIRLHYQDWTLSIIRPTEKQLIQVCIPTILLYYCKLGRYVFYFVRPWRQHRWISTAFAP